MKLVLRSPPEKESADNPKIHSDGDEGRCQDPVTSEPRAFTKDLITEITSVDQLLEATQQNMANSLALYFFETNLIDRFAACYEKEISNNAMFQQKLLELSDSDNNCHSNEFLLKHLIENNKDCQFGEMKKKLFKEFDKILSDIMKTPDEESTENKTDLTGAKIEMIKERLHS